MRASPARVWEEQLKGGRVHEGSSHLEEPCSSRRPWSSSWRPGILLLLPPPPPPPCLGAPGPAAPPPGLRRRGPPPPGPLALGSSAPGPGLRGRGPPCPRAPRSALLGPPAAGLRDRGLPSPGGPAAGLRGREPPSPGDGVAWSLGSVTAALASSSAPCNQKLRITRRSGRSQLLEDPTECLLVAQRGVQRDCALCYPQHNEHHDSWGLCFAQVRGHCFPAWFMGERLDVAFTRWGPSLSLTHTHTHAHRKSPRCGLHTRVGRDNRSGAVRPTIHLLSSPFDPEPCNQNCTPGTRGRDWDQVFDEWFDSIRVRCDGCCLVQFLCGVFC